MALNYSRASMHRIRRNPSVRVLTEEQDKILNHLNLNGVADPEVVQLYSSVLDEVSQVQLAESEKHILQEKYRHSFNAGLTANAFTLAAQVATANYPAAVRTGANSWWDYRTMGVNRDLDVWRVDKARYQSIVTKSNQFLDVSWKMARNRQIPDRWLVRGDDLDKLELACHESDSEVRLRVLKRMEPFMECYPPYWYYVARTQQSMGQLFAAGETYDQLAKLGSGHFRKDEMLACGLANRAMIQAYLHQPGMRKPRSWLSPIRPMSGKPTWSAPASCCSTNRATRPKTRSCAILTAISNGARVSSHLSRSTTRPETRRNSPPASPTRPSCGTCQRPLCWRAPRVWGKAICPRHW